MGRSARERVIRQLRPGWTLRARHWQLTIRLPPDQITPGLADQIKGAIYRFCLTKIDDNTIPLRNVRWKGIRKLPFGFTFLAICIRLGSLFGSGTIAAIPTWLGTTFNEGLTIVGWVSLTGPAETLIFDPLPIKEETKILSILMDIPIENRPA